MYVQPRDVQLICNDSLEICEQNAYHKACFNSQIQLHNQINSEKLSIHDIFTHYEIDHSFLRPAYAHLDKNLNDNLFSKNNDRSETTIYQDILTTHNYDQSKNNTFNSVYALSNHTKYDITYITKINAAISTSTNINESRDKNTIYKPEDNAV